MQVKSTIVYITMALAAVTVLHAPVVHGEEMTYYSKATPAEAAAPVVYSSSGKVITPARVKVMQNEQKILGHSPYAKAAGVDLSQVGSNTVPVVTPAPVPAPTPIAADASLSPERIEIIQMELKELGFSPHTEATGVDLKKVGFVVPDRATTASGASDPDATATTTNSDVVQTDAGY
ncbi:hypothetical protein Gpo141_00005212 [Globisporangium polare]